MEQLLLHLIGDYWFQTDKQALNKKKSSWYCFQHVFTYSILFLLIASWKAVLVIMITHFIIDRWNIVPYIIAIKNGAKKPYFDHLYSLKLNVYDISNFGFAKDRPFALSIWLMIICDNTLHLVINYLAIMYL